MIRTSTVPHAINSVVSGETDHLSGGNMFTYTFPDPKTLINQILSFKDFDDNHKFYIWTTKEIKEIVNEYFEYCHKVDGKINQIYGDIAKIRNFYKTFGRVAFICDKVPLHCTKDDYLIIINIDQEYAKLFVESMNIKDYTIYNHVMFHS